MHSSLTRVQNVFGFFTTVIFVFAALIASTDFLAPRTPSADVFVKDLQVCVSLSPPLKQQNFQLTPYTLQSPWPPTLLLLEEGRVRLY
jgi:hypothetical protein